MDLQVYFLELTQTTKTKASKFGFAPHNFSYTPVIVFVLRFALFAGVALALWTLAAVSAVCYAALHLTLPETGKASLEQIAHNTIGN